MVITVELPDGVRCEPGQGSLDKVVVETDLARAEVYLHGAHITHYQPRDHDPLIWLSRQAVFQFGKAIRGGIPICFPWFGQKADDPKAPSHGTARISLWKLESAERKPDGHVVITLALQLDRLELSHRITIGRSLDAALLVVNHDDRPRSYEVALHTYFVVGDVRQVEVHGLERAEYLDRLKPGERFTQDDRPIRFIAETDRTYVNTDSPVTIVDPVMRRRIVNRKRGSRSTVVWNPWIDKARAMADFGDDEWPGMLCVETANVGENAVTLAPGESHTTGAMIEVAR